MRRLALHVGLSMGFIFLVLMCGIRRIPQSLPAATPLLFNANNAYSWTRRLATEFPNRVVWRPEKHAAGRFLQRQFQILGYDTHHQTFSETVGSRKLSDLQNIFVELPAHVRSSVSNEIVVVLAHYDIAENTIEGAADDASGVGTVLELARLFKESVKRYPNQRTVLFLLTDSEEFGAFWGAKYFVEHFDRSDKIVAAISLDFMAPRRQEEIIVLSDGLWNGYAPLWLREVARHSLAQIQFPFTDLPLFTEYLQRALQIPAADHGPFLAKGVPSINLFGRNQDFADQMKNIHHTPNDKIAFIETQSSHSYGRAAEAIIRNIDSLPPLLNRSDLRASQYWKLTQQYYLEWWAVILIQISAFLPFFLHVLIEVQSTNWKRSPFISQTVFSNLRSFVVVLGGLLVGYLCIRMFPVIDLVEKYEIFPATQKSDLLYRPQLLLILTSLVLGLFASLLLHRVIPSVLLRQSHQDSIHKRHVIFGLMLALLVALALCKNAYLATLLLLPPAYLWSFMRYRGKVPSTGINIALFMGGFIALGALGMVLSTIFHIGVFYWYVFLALSYGLITIYTALIGFGVIALGISILRNLLRW